MKSPEVRYTQGEKAMCIARFNLAVERRGKDNGADYPNMIAFGKTAEFVEKHINKGTKVVVRSHYQSGSYTNKDGQKVYTHDFVVDDIEFAESKAASQQNQQTAPAGNNINDYVNSMPSMEDLPFA
jgi:single-strand DNA-binding protein